MNRNYRNHHFSHSRKNSPNEHKKHHRNYSFIISIQSKLNNNSRNSQNKNNSRIHNNLLNVRYHHNKNSKKNSHKNQIKKQIRQRKWMKNHDSNRNLSRVATVNWISSKMNSSNTSRQSRNIPTPNRNSSSKNSKPIHLPTYIHINTHDRDSKKTETEKNQKLPYMKDNSSQHVNSTNNNNIKPKPNAKTANNTDNSDRLRLKKGYFDRVKQKSLTK